MVLICISQILSEVEHFFMYLFGHLYVFFGKISIEVVCQAFNWVVTIFLLTCIFCILTVYWIGGLQIFPFIPQVAFNFVDSFLCCVEAFQFDVAQLIYFCFCCLYFWCQITTIIAKTNQHQKAYPLCFLLGVLWFQSLHSSLISF